MRERILDPHNQPNTAAERRLGVTPQRDQNRAQERALRYQENKGLAVVDDEGRLIGELIRELQITGAGLTVTVQGNRVTVDASASSGTTIAVQEGDVTESLTVDVLDFDDSSFDVSISPAGEANVDLAYGTGAGQPAEGNHTHAYAAPLTIQEGGVTTETTVDLINFDASDFNVSNPVNNQVSVTLAYGTSAGTPAEGNHAHSLTDLSDTGTIAPATTGKTLTWDGANWNDMSIYCESLGPWYEDDIAGTATTSMKLLYMNTGTAVSQSTNRIRAGRTGWIVGAKITADNARTAGTCTVQVDLSGVGTAFDAGSVVLDGTRTTQDATIVTAASGIQIASGSDTIGVQLVTSGWTPTTGNAFVSLLVIWDPIA